MATGDVRALGPFLDELEERLGAVDAEALALSGNNDAGTVWLEGVRAGYPRHYAFRRSGEEATLSPLARAIPHG